MTTLASKHYQLPNGSIYKAIYQDNGWLFMDVNKSFPGVVVCLIPFNGLLYFGEYRSWTKDKEWITPLRATEWKIDNLKECQIEKIIIELNRR